MPLSPPAPLGVALVGFGPWGRNLARVVAAGPRTRLAVVCERNAERLARAKGLFPGVAVTEDFDICMGSQGVDAVVVATPPATHASLTLRALAKGKHVFVEKPLALQSSHVRRIEQVAEEQARVVMVGHILLHHPGFLALVGLVARGELGHVHSIQCTRTGGSTQASPEGPWWSLAPHDVSASCFLMGARPMQVAARRLDGLVPGVEARLDFSEGRTAFIRVGATQHTKTRELTVFGSRRTAVFDDLAPIHKVRVYPAVVDLSPEGAGSPRLGTPATLCGPFESVAFPGTEPLALEVDHFARSITEGFAPRSDLREGTRVVGVLEAGALSLAAEGAPFPVAFPLAPSASSLSASSFS